VSRFDELVKALVNAQVGGFLAQPPDMFGQPALGVAGITGMPRGKTWDVATSARAGDLIGDTVTFVTLEDGTVIVDQDEPDESLAPLADAIEEAIDLRTGQQPSDRRRYLGRDGGEGRRREPARDRGRRRRPHDPER
jgi:hypothetical protein